MCMKIPRKKTERQEKKKLIANQADENDEAGMFSVDIRASAVENLFYGLPVGTTRMDVECRPEDPAYCTDKEMTFLGLLCKLDDTYRKEFENLEKPVKGPTENAELMCNNCD